MIAIVILFAVEKSFQSLYKLRLLLFHLLLVGVTWEVDVLSLLGLLRFLTLWVAIFRDERLFFIEVVKPGAVLLIFDYRLE